MANSKLRQIVWGLVVLAAWGVGSLFHQVEALAKVEDDVEQPQPLLDLDVVSDPFTQFNAPEIKPAQEEAMRNPFAATDKLRQMEALPREGMASGDVTFVPGTRVQEKIPKLRLRGHLQGLNGEVLALLEIGGGDTYIVREGDTVGLHDLGIDSVIRVQKISRLHLVVESGSLNQMIIVR